MSRKDFDQLIQDFGELEKHSCFPAGEYTHYIYDFFSDSILCIGDNIEHMLGIGHEEVESKRMADFFSEFIVEEHVKSLIPFGKIFYEFLSTNKMENTQVMLEIDMETRKKITKRILIQFRPALFDKQGKLAATWGVFTDITSIKRSGPPQLHLMRNNRVVNIFKGDIQEMLESESLPLNLQETEILSLRARGYQVKEIASKMHLQTSTIFSYLRDIRRKTNMDIIPLIRLLSEKGIIN